MHSDTWVVSGAQPDALTVSVSDADFRDRLNAELAFCSMAVDAAKIASDAQLDEAIRLMRRIRELDAEIETTLATKRNVIDGILSAWQSVEERWLRSTEELKAELMRRIRSYAQARNKALAELVGTEEAVNLAHPDLTETEEITVELDSIIALAEAVAKKIVPGKLLRLNHEEARKLAEKRPEIPGVSIRRRKTLCISETTSTKP